MWQVLLPPTHEPQYTDILPPLYCLPLLCTVGCCLATLLAWWVPGWRALAFIGGLACLAYMGAWSLVIESPSWLLLKARKVRAGRARLWSQPAQAVGCASDALRHLFSCACCSAG